MTARYQVLQRGGVWDFQTRTTIPPDRSNAAWVEYQEWLTGGNTPLPPDTVGMDDLATAKRKRQDEIDAYARAIYVDTPEPDSIVAVVQMLRQRQQEALREAGQMTLI